MKLPKNLTNIVIATIVVAIVVGVGAYFVFGGAPMRTVTARFTSGVGVYPGTPVKILGVDVGEVTKVTPSGNYVTIKMEYEKKYQLPANAISVVVANSLVSDRYLQLAPAYSGSGPTLPDNAVIPLSRTTGPAELDDIYAALNRLTVALGPEGVNKNGALSRFIKVSEANLTGNGAALGSSITKLSQAVTTLSSGREDLFGTVRNLQTLTGALADSDLQIKHFEEQFAQVAGDLASERQDLGAALHNLGNALDSVATFVRANRAKLHKDLGGLKVISQILVDQQSSLNETLAVGPVALANIIHAYQPDLGVIATRGNLASITDPANLCQALNIGGLLDPLAGLLGPLTGKIAAACHKVLSKLPSGSKFKLPSGLDPAQFKALLQSMLGDGGGLGNIITGGS